MSGLIDTRQSSAPITLRPFVQRGLWSGYARCDAKVQRDATLRVSVLAGLITLGLMATPSVKLNSIDKKFGPSITISAPEIAHANTQTSKGLHRIPTLEEVTGSAPLKRLAATSLDETPIATMPMATPLHDVEIIDVSTVRSGSKTVRLLGIEAPKDTDICTRLDGLTVSCQDRALSYLQLLVKGRKIACSSSKATTDDAEEGSCRFGETDIAEQLVRQGWAKAGALPEERIVSAELAAKRQKLGIWRQ